MVSRVTAVAVLRTVTVAPGTAPLLLSTTEPPIWPLSPWAWARPGAPTARPTVRRARTPMNRCTFPPLRSHGSQVPGFRGATGVAVKASPEKRALSRTAAPMNGDGLCQLWSGLVKRKLRYTKVVCHQIRGSGSGARGRGGVQSQPARSKRLIASGDHRLHRVPNPESRARALNFLTTH